MPTSQQDTKYWYDWNDPAAPCIFSREEALPNAVWLRSTFGEKWIAKRAGENEHPLKRFWYAQTGQSFLYLNALAVDMRRLSGVAGFDGLVEELKNAKLFDSTLHVIRAAGLLTRSGDLAVRQFFGKSQTTVPDFTLEHQGSEIAVEAKLLGRSDIETGFSNWALSLASMIETQIRSVMPRPWVKVIVKDPIRRAPVGEILDSLKVLLAGSGRVVKTPAFNLEKDLGPGNYVVAVVSPRSDSEALRFTSRAKKASSQLRSQNATKRSGLVVLGGNPVGHLRYMTALIKQRLDAGNYSSVGAVFLLNWNTLSPPAHHGILESAAYVSLAGPAHDFMAGRTLKPIDRLVRLERHDPPSGLVAIYSGQIAAGVAPDNVSLPLIETVTTEQLS